MKKVKGLFFVDYVRMLRSRKNVDWEGHLLAEDLTFLEGRIQEAEWYPFGTFERMGLAIVREYAGGNVDAARAWGRASVDNYSRVHESLVCKGNPMESLMRFQVLRTSFFNFDPVILDLVTPLRAVLEIRFGMGEIAEHAATLQTLGYFERILELSGALDIRHRFLASTWEGAPVTKLRLDWSER